MKNLLLIAICNFLVISLISASLVRSSGGFSDGLVCGAVVYPNCPEGERPRFFGTSAKGLFCLGATRHYEAPDAVFEPNSRCTRGYVKGSLQITKVGYGDCEWERVWADDLHEDDCRAEYTVYIDANCFTFVTCYWTVCEKLKIV